MDSCFANVWIVNGSSNELILESLITFLLNCKQLIFSPTYRYSKATIRNQSVQGLRLEEKSFHFLLYPISWQKNWMVYIQRGLYQKKILSYHLFQNPLVISCHILFKTSSTFLTLSPYITLTSPTNFWIITPYPLPGLQKGVLRSIFEHSLYAV